MAPPMRYRAAAWFGRGAGVVRAEVTGRGDKHRGLFLNNGHVVVHGVGFAGTDGLAHLAGHQLFKGIRKVAYGMGI